MNIKENRPAKKQGLIVLISRVFILFLMTGAAAAVEPTPALLMSVRLVETPHALMPRILPILNQNALAHSMFYFNLKPFVTMPQTEISYWITNLSASLDHQTEGIVGHVVSAEALPTGVSQTSRNIGDCYPLLDLPSRGSCRLRFHVDPAAYTPSPGGDAPLVMLQVLWKWGAHYKRNGGANISARPLTAIERITNVLAPIMVVPLIVVTPIEQDGLRYDSTLSSIVGVPTHIGDYRFIMRAVNGSLKSAPQIFTIHVKANPQDTPVFKSQYRMASAMPERAFQLDLMTLIETHPSFGVSNQIYFRMDTRREHPSWLSVDNDMPTILHGHVPPNEGGQVKHVTLIATSSTGGDSEPWTIAIPVAFDLEKKPSIQKDVVLNGLAGKDIHFELRQYLTDPASDGSLRVILDAIKPAAPWLSVSNAMALEGMVPIDSAGQTYRLTLSANTATGGSSDPVTILLCIAIDASQTPRFITNKPILPLLYPGQSYQYDFKGNHDISPDYAKSPYEVELASGYNNPLWLRIENNQLLVDEVPSDIEEPQLIFVTIKNIPGGISSVQSISLTMMK